MDLSRIAARVARLRTASEYDEMLDDYMNRLADADSFLNVVRDKTPVAGGEGDRDRLAPGPVPTHRRRPRVGAKAQVHGALQARALIEVWGQLPHEAMA